MASIFNSIYGLFTPKKPHRGAKRRRQISPEKVGAQQDVSTPPAKALPKCPLSSAQKKRLQTCILIDSGLSSAKACELAGINPSSFSRMKSFMDSFAWLWGTSFGNQEVRKNLVVSILGRHGYYDVDELLICKLIESHEEKNGEF